MQNIPHLVLSDYQKAILTEMGISAWQLADDGDVQAKVDSSPLESVTTSSQTTSKEDALAKLKHLKEQTQISDSTDSVLVTFSSSEIELQIFTDILIALELDTQSQKIISISDLSRYVDYPLCWIQGEKICLEQKQLITPPLSELYDSEIKKQLWQQLQSASFFEKSN